MVVFWTYLLAFAVAFCFVFIFPQVTLILLFLAIFGLIFAVIGRAILNAAECFLARRILRADRCPRCASPGRMAPNSAGRCVCAACGTSFDPRGSELDPELDPKLDSPVPIVAAS